MDELESWFECLIFDRKGTLEISFNYHESDWVATWCDKRQTLRASSIKPFGDGGQNSIFEALKELKLKIENMKKGK